MTDDSFFGEQITADAFFFTKYGIIYIIYILYNIINYSSPFLPLLRKLSSVICHQNPLKFAICDFKSPNPTTRWSDIIKLK